MYPVPPGYQSPPKSNVGRVLLIVLAVVVGVPVLVCALGAGLFGAFSVHQDDPVGPTPVEAPSASPR
jgi:hypothetical protein